MSVNERAFIDSNIFIYLYSATEIKKQKIAMNCVDNYDCVISTQVLNEFCNVCVKKFNINAKELNASIKEIIEGSILLFIDIEDVSNAISLHEKLGYGYWDCLMLVSALKSECKYIFTEDLQDGQLIENRLIIKNIFQSTTSP